MENIISNIPENLSYAIGFTLLSSLWQAVVVVSILLLVVQIFPRMASRLKYLIYNGSLLMISAISIRTFIEKFNGPLQTKQYLLVKSGAGKKLISGNNELITNADIGSFNYLGFWNELRTFLFENIELIVLLWITGLALYSIKLIGGIIYSNRLKTKDVYPSENSIIKIKNSLCEKIQLNRHVQIFESFLVKVPSVIGFLKPVILLPAGFINGLSYQQIEFIILHELIHIKRMDYFINILQSIQETIFFFNPAVLWLSNKIRDERENVCDDLVVKYSDSSFDYMETLLKSAELKNGLIPEIALFKNKNQLYRRIKRMSGGKTKYNISAFIASLFALTLMVSMFVACSSTGNWESNDPDAESVEISMTTNEDGVDKDYEIKMENGDIVELKVDGTEVPEEEYSDYKEKLFKQRKHFKNHWNRNKISREQIENLVDELTEEFSGKNFSFEFDKDEFKESMKELKRELKRVEKERVNINLELEEAFENIPEIDIPDMEFKINGEEFNIEFDKHEFKESMKELKRNLKDIKVDVKIEAGFAEEVLEKTMKELKENMKDIKIDLSEMKVELKKLKHFFNDLSEGLYEDGYISDPDDEFELDFETDYMEVDGKRVKDEDFIKYKKLYKKHFGKEFDGDFVIMNRD